MGLAVTPDRSSRVRGGSLMTIRRVAIVDESPVYALAYFCLARVALASITPWMLPFMVAPCAVSVPVTLPGR